jgi:hypothetical protein
VERLDGWLALAASELPSRVPSLAATGVAPAPRRPASPEDSRKVRAALEAELARAREAEKLQARLDGLQTRMFRMEELLKEGEHLRARAGEAETAREALAPAREALGTLGDPAARLGALERATARRDEALARLSEERQALGEPETSAPPGPPWRDLLLSGGLGVSALALLGGLLSPLGGMALIAIPASGVSAWRALRWVNASEGHERSSRRFQYLADRERKIRDAWEKETAPVRAALAAAGVASTSEARDLWQRVREAEAAVEAERSAIEAWEARAETRDAAADRARLQKEIGEIEARLTGDGAWSRDPQAVEQDLARLDAGGTVPGPAPVAPEPPPVAPGVDPLRSLVERAAAETGQTAGSALRAVQQRLGLVLATLSGQRLAGLLVDERGNLVVQSGGRPVPVATLPPPERDACFLALRVAFLEGAVNGQRAVAVLADPFGALPEGTRRAVARLLKQVGRAGQVIHATTDIAFREAADHAA